MSPGRALKVPYRVRYTACMAGARPDPDEIEDAIREAFTYGRTSIDDVAQILTVSRSTVERALAESGRSKEPTDFTSLRRKVRLKIGLPLLTNGESVRSVAEKVCLSPDHLTVIVREETGLTPRQIIRAACLRKRIEDWKREGPLRQGTTLYRMRLRAWDRIDAELTNLLGDLGPSHPLARWAKQLLVNLERPDYRRQPYRDVMRANRKREGEVLQRRLKAHLNRINSDRRPEAEITVRNQS
jgi:AraC-like DNA-binding protein